MGVYGERGLLTELRERLLLGASAAPGLGAALRLLAARRAPRMWLFIVGCYNSGTTLLGELLGWHPEISALPREGARLSKRLPRPEDLGWTRLWSECPDRMLLPAEGGPALAAAIRRDWAPFFRAGSKVFAEKSVSNLPRMPWLDRHFENAHFLGIVRHPYPVCAGLLRKARPTGAVRDRIGPRYPLRLVVKQWIEANRLLLRHAGEVRRCHIVRYERLTRSPEAVLGEAFRFLGLEIPPMSYESGVLSMCGRRLPVENMNARGSRDLTDADRDLIDGAAGELMRRLGYSRDPLAEG